MATSSLHPLLHYLRRLSGGVASDSDLDDTQLLRRFLSNRDQTAFTMIVQRYGAMVWGPCVRRLGETPEAEDAFQATFLVLVRKAPSLRGPELLGPFLYGVAYRTALKVRGRRARLASRETALPEQPAGERPEQVWTDLRPVIDEEVNRLPEKYRQPVLLCYLQGMSSEEAARHLGCAKGTVFSRLSRARDLLRRRLGRRGLGVPAGVLAVVLTENGAARAVPPATLCESTIRMSLSFAAGTAGQAMSAPLSALVEGVLRSMFLSKVKLAVVVLLALGLVGSGAGFVAHRTVAGQPRAQSDQPAGVGAKAKEKVVVEAEAKAPAPAPKPKNEPIADAKLDEKQRLRDWRDKLMHSIHFDGWEDPNITLSEGLDQLTKRYDIAFRFNEKAFKFENVEDVAQMKIVARPIPPMKASMDTLLKTILARVPVPTGAVFLVRKDHIEITTTTFLRAELGFRNERPVLPLIWDAFDETPLDKILPRVAETSGYNVVADPHAEKELQTKLTAKFNNVPVDTALRLLVNMAGLSVVRLDNVFYVTTVENAKRLREEQAQINADPNAEPPAPDKKPAK
jgi:RNA polymerase sigma factor (sigma-70 family)